MNSVDHYAVFGKPIAHSQSPRIHQLFAKQTQQHLSYQAQAVGKEDFKCVAYDFFTKGGKGLNCTVPLKELAYQFADQLTPRAKYAQAVNTLSLQQDGTVLGDNTDGCGLIKDLTCNHQLTLTAKRILILGAGGAARGIIEPIMQQAPKQLVIANRTLKKSVALAIEFEGLNQTISGCGFADLVSWQFDLILNATSASLSNQLPPLPKNLLAKNACCYDLAYGRQPTPFVDWGVENNAFKSVDGLGMLVEQAAEAFYSWRKIRPDTQAVIRLLNQRSA
jgi:shikimate dehydrogenase